MISSLQEEREKEEQRLQEILEENNSKILQAQRKLVRLTAVRDKESEPISEILILSIECAAVVTLHSSRKGAELISMHAYISIPILQWVARNCRGFVNVRDSVI